MTLAVALAIWFRRGIQGEDTIKLYPSALDKFGVNRWSSYRALAALEKAGLVSVKRQRGSAPLVTILDLTPSADDPARLTGQGPRDG